MGLFQDENNHVGPRFILVYSVRDDGLPLLGDRLVCKPNAEMVQSNGLR